MKKLTQLTLLLLAMVVAFAGCDAAKDAASNAANSAGDLADMEFGGVKASDLKEKIAGITKGFTNVSEENADELKEKISEFDGTIGEIKVDELSAPAKTAATGMMSGFASSLEGLMEKVPAPIKEKLEPVVAPLMEKLKAFGG